jgi:UDP-N-acetylglucosamine 2-epimerase (non-hydrolysing)
MPQPIRVLFVFGTRPEAIKMCPVVLQLREDPRFAVKCCVTAQHRSMLDQVLSVFGVVPDYDLNVMTPGQTLPALTARLMEGLDGVLGRENPDIVLVQGDTTTCFAGALAAFYRRLDVGHIEAGLRTGDRYQPFPEEINRVLVGRLATLHFPPTDEARRNLLAEGIAEDGIYKTGNTGIDAVLHVSDRLSSGKLTLSDRIQVDEKKKIILVTCHRRENFGDGVQQICQALLELSRRKDVQIIFPVHRNPNVWPIFNSQLSGRPNITLLEPLAYVPFIDLMRRAYLILTDSGGIQEEAPSLGKPVLVMREKTERPEAVQAGTARLVGTDSVKIGSEANRLLDDCDGDQSLYQKMTRQYNPYGDGKASERIQQALLKHFARFSHASHVQ